MVRELESILIDVYMDAPSCPRIELVWNDEFGKNRMKDIALDL